MNDIVKIIENGTTKWYKNDKLHRENDEPAVIWKDGRMCWYQNGKRHRDFDRPAIIYKNGTMCWYQNGKLFREGNKPVKIYADGKTKYLKDKQNEISQEEELEELSDSDSENLEYIIKLGIHSYKEYIETKSRKTEYRNIPFNAEYETNCESNKEQYDDEYILL